MDSLLDILQWAFPTGFSLVNLALMASLWRKNRARLVADTRDIWQQIAESNNDALLRQNDEIRNLRDAVARLEAVVQKLLGCPHWGDCPARIIVQDYRKLYFRHPDRQSGMGQKGVHHARDHPDEPGGAPPAQGESF